MASFENWDLKTMYSYMTEAPDFVYEYLPSSFGMESKTRQEWQAYNDRHKIILPDFRVRTIHIVSCNVTLTSFCAHLGRCPRYP
jgi:hypothetical protein